MLCLELIIYQYPVFGNGAHKILSLVLVPPSISFQPFYRQCSKSLIICYVLKLVRKVGRDLMLCHVLIEGKEKETPKKGY